MAGSILALQRLIPMPATRIGDIIETLIVIAAGGLVYGVGLFVLRSPELRELLSRGRGAVR